MKHLFRLFLLLLISTTAIGQTIVPLGNSGNTVEVKGGLTIDSALAVPFTSSFTGKGTDVNRRIEAARTDSLPTWMRRGSRLKILTQWDSTVYYIPPSQKANANGVASLDGTGKVPLAQLPALITSGQVFIDNSQAAMLGHAGATAGAFSVRTDSSNALFVLTTTPSSVRANWIPTSYTNAVLAFGPTGNLRTGVVTPRAGDYITDSVAEGINNLYFTAARAQAQIWLDTPAKLATQYYVNTHSGGNLQALLGIGDSATYNIFLAKNLGRTFAPGVGKGSSVWIATEPDGGGWIGVQDTSGVGGVNPYGVITMKVGGALGSGRFTSAEIHLASGQFNGNPALNKQNSVFLLADTGSHEASIEAVGQGNDYQNMDSNSHWYTQAGYSGSFVSRVKFPFLAHNDTILYPDKSGTIALTTDVAGIGLNSVLTNSPNSNQAINLGKKVSGYALYRNTFVGLNTDSSGEIILLDTNGSSTVIISTLVGSPPSVITSSGAGLAGMDPTTGVYAQSGIRSITMTNRNLNFVSTTGKYKHINDSADFSTVPLKIGKATSAARQYGSTFVGLSGGSDSSGKIVVQDTANATTVTIQSASTTAQITCAAASNTSSISSSVGLTSFHIVGNGGSPTIQAGAAAGTGPTISVTGTDLAGYISVTTGTSPSASAIVCTLTFATAYGAVPRFISIPTANKNANALLGAAVPYVNQASILTTSFPINVETALNANTTYQFYYNVIR